MEKKLSEMHKKKLVRNEKKIHILGGKGRENDEKVRKYAVCLRMFIFFADITAKYWRKNITA